MDELIEILADLVVKKSIKRMTNMDAQHLIDVGHISIHL